MAVFLVSCQDKIVSPPPSEPEPASTAILIPPQGGRFAVSPGLSLTVPVGAVSRETRIQIRRFPTSEAKVRISKATGDTSSIVVAIECLPHGQQFESAVTVQVDSVFLPDGTLPIFHSLGPGDSTWSADSSRLRYDPRTHGLEFSMRHFSGGVVQASSDPYADLNSCRTKGVRQVSHEPQAICSQGAGACQIVESTVRVSYPECPDNKEQVSTFLDVSRGCIPKLELSASPSTISEGDKSTITAKAQVGCPIFQKALQDQEIRFQVEGPASLDPSKSRTDSTGRSQTTFLGLDSGTATVLATAEFNYSAREVKVDGTIHSSIPATHSRSTSIPVRILPSKKGWRIHFQLEGADSPSPERTLDGTGRNHHFTYSISMDFSVPETPVEDFLEGEAIQSVSGVSFIDPPYCNASLTPLPRGTWSRVGTPSALPVLVEVIPLSSPDSLGFVILPEAVDFADWADLCCQKCPAGSNLPRCQGRDTVCQAMPTQLGTSIHGIEGESSPLRIPLKDGWSGKATAVIGEGSEARSVDPKTLPVYTVSVRRLP